MMVRAGRLTVLRATDKKDLVKAISYITTPALIEPVLGSPLGGFIVTHVRWEWIFFLNLPLGMIALFAAMQLIPEYTETRTRPFAQGSGRPPRIVAASANEELTAISAPAPNSCLRLICKRSSDNHGISPLTEYCESMNEIIWPEGYLPGFTENFVSNEVIVVGLTAPPRCPRIACSRIAANSFRLR